jgi:hypothetical protein
MERQVILLEDLIEVFKEMNNGSFIVRAPKNTGWAITSWPPVFRHRTSEPGFESGIKPYRSPLLS